MREASMSEKKHTLPPQQQARQPGIEAEMTPKPDYKPRFPGAGRLSGKVAVISGVTAASAGRWPWRWRARARAS
jgi:hypothetical protein